MAADEKLEQAVYESLQRTNDKKYLEFLNSIYEMYDMPWYYTPMENKTAFMQKYKKFEERSSYKENMAEFEKFLEMIDVHPIIEKTQDFTFVDH